MTNERTGELGKVDSHSLDTREDLIQRLLSVVPELATDGKIDVEKLIEILADKVEDSSDRYDFTWSGKKKAMKLAQQPSVATLKPNKDKSKNWDTTQNIYIEGDNLEVLKLLQKSYSSKVDAIYIDPPYNTGRDIIYPNNFGKNLDEYLKITGQVDRKGNMYSTNTDSNGRYHSDWLDMMYPRLKLARNLLSHNGIIVVTIDDHELPRLTMIMDEIFGETNRLGTVTIKNNPSGRSTTKGFAISNEYALFYSKSEETQIGRLPRNNTQISRYKESDSIGKFEWTNFRKHGGFKEDAPTMYYPIYIKNDGVSFRIPNMKWSEKNQEYDVFDEPDNDEFISYPIDENGRERRWKWGLDRAMNSSQNMGIRKDKNKLYSVYIKSRMNDEGLLPLTIWDSKEYSATEYGTNYLKKLFGGRTFDYPKSIHAVVAALRVASNKKDALILDFFSGSGTTADAVFRLNFEDGGSRRFIVVQIPEKVDEKSDAHKAGFKTIPEIAEKRIDLVGDTLVDENKVFVGEADIGFKVFELDKSNIKKWDSGMGNLEEQLEFIERNFEHSSTPLDIVYEVLLKQGLDLSFPVSEYHVGPSIIYSIAFGAMFIVLGESIEGKIADVIIKKRDEYEAENTIVIFQDEKFVNDSEKLNAIETLNENGIQYDDVMSI